MSQPRKLERKACGSDSGGWLPLQISLQFSLGQLIRVLSISSSAKYAEVMLLPENLFFHDSADGLFGLKASQYRLSETVNPNIPTISDGTSEFEIRISS